MVAMDDVPMSDVPVSDVPASEGSPSVEDPAAMTAYLRTRPGSGAVAALDLVTGRSVAHRSTSTFVTASIVKVDVLVALLLAEPAGSRGLTGHEASLARAMIERSDNAAASALWRAAGGPSGLARANRRLGLTDTVPGHGGYWGNTRTTARDQVRLLGALTDPDGPLGSEARAYALGLMEHVVSGQRWGVPVVSAHPAQAAVKNGWLDTVTDRGRWTVNSIGRVVLVNGNPALLAVLTRGSPNLATGIRTVEHLARLAAEALLA